jgi:hypothetical protein
MRLTSKHNSECNRLYAPFLSYITRSLAVGTGGKATAVRSVSPLSRHTEFSPNRFFICHKRSARAKATVDRALFGDRGLCQGVTALFRGNCGRDMRCGDEYECHGLVVG